MKRVAVGLLALAALAGCATGVQHKTIVVNGQSIECVYNADGLSQAPSCDWAHPGTTTTTTSTTLGPNVPTTSNLPQQTHDGPGNS